MDMGAPRPAVAAMAWRFQTVAASPVLRRRVRAMMAVVLIRWWLNMVTDRIA